MGSGQARGGEAIELGIKGSGQRPGVSPAAPQLWLCLTEMIFE